MKLNYKFITFKVPNVMPQLNHAATNATTLNLYFQEIYLTQTEFAIGKPNTRIYVIFWISLLLLLLLLEICVMSHLDRGNPCCISPQKATSAGAQEAELWEPARA